MLTATEYAVQPQNSSCNSSCNYSEAESVGRLLWGYAKGHGGEADGDEMLALPSWQVVVLGILSASSSLLTIVGNLIVILSFIVERSIRQTSNYFIASLAVSDLLIGCFSMPLYTVYMLSGQHWTLGEVSCDLWLSLDYTVCLCSIYTVFCITVDRYCSVTIPAKYHRWRTERKVVIIVGATWTLPVMVFFTSIIGWQYFVHERTVPEGKCYVQYMDSALFNCLLQVGYFWVTLVVMCGLYAGIYRVALRLHRKSEGRRKKMTSLVSMAGRTMTNIGIGMTGQQKQQRREATTSSPGQQKKKKKQQQQENPARSPSEECKKPLIQMSQLSNNQTVESRSDWQKDTEWKTTHCPANSNAAVRDIIFKNNFNKNDHFSEDIREDSTSGVRMYRHSLQVFSSQLPDSCLFNAKPNRRSSPSSNFHQIQMTKDTNNDTDISRCQTKVTDADSQLPFHTKPVTEGRLPNNRARKCSANHDRPLLSRESLTTNHERQISTRDSLKSTHGENGNGSNGKPHDCEKTADGDDDFGRSLPIPVLYGHRSGARLQQEQPEAEERETYWKQLLRTVEIFPRSASTSNAETNQRDDPNDSAATALRDCPSVTKRTLLRNSLPAGFLGFYATAIIDNTDEKCALHVHGSGVETETTTADQSGCDDDRPSPSAETSLLFANAQQLTSCESDCPEQAHLLAPPSSSAHQTSGANSSDGGVGGADSSSVPEQKRRRRSRFLATRQQWSSRRRRAELRRGAAAAAAAAAAKRNAEDPDEMGDDDDRHQDPGCGGGGGRQQLKRKNENRAKKSLRTITLILGAFVVCWTPWHVLSLIIGFCPESSVCVPPILYDVSYWLCYINSPMNPFCYAFANQQFKKTFVRILRFDWHRT